MDLYLWKHTRLADRRPENGADWSSTTFENKDAKTNIVQNVADATIPVGDHPTEHNGIGQRHDFDQGFGQISRMDTDSGSVIDLVKESKKGYSQEHTSKTNQSCQPWIARLSFMDFVGCILEIS